MRLRLAFTRLFANSRSALLSFPPPRTPLLCAKSVCSKVHGALERCGASVGALAEAKRGAETDLSELQESVRGTEGGEGVAVLTQESTRCQP